jgi:TPR repeat protein
MRETPASSSGQPAKITRRFVFLTVLAFVFCGSIGAAIWFASSKGYESIQDESNRPKTGVGSIVTSSSLMSPAEFAKRARDGDPKMQLSLGEDYFNGTFQIKDEAEALKWVTKASEAGHVPAHARLGYLYANMKGSLRDQTLAYKYYLKAAMHGDVDSQYIVGSRLLYGEGVARNGITAYAWFNVCAANSNQHSAYMRDFIAEKMTPAQIDEAQKISRSLIQQIEANQDKK